MLAIGPHPSTFSIVAADVAAREWGVAVASKFLAVGAVVPWARAGAGAVATQALANTAYGPGALDLMGSGVGAREALGRLVEADPERDHRQAGVVDAKGEAATYTGPACLPWAGGFAGLGFAVQGNILASGEVVAAMADAFRRAQGSLAERLLMALLAGDRAGGDRRGRQSAALVVVRAGAGYGGRNDRFVDLRVDDHADPVAELARLYGLWRLYFEPPRPEDALPLVADRVREIRSHLIALGYLAADPQGGASPTLEGGLDGATREALRTFASVENLEERLGPPDAIDGVVLEYLRAKAEGACGVGGAGAEDPGQDATGR